MRLFKLKALSCAGKHNKVLRKKDNETYLESAFHNPDELLEKGYIYEVTARGEEVAPSSTADFAEVSGDSAIAAAAAAAFEVEGSTDEVENSNPYATMEVDDLKLKEWKAEADKAGIEYGTKVTRAELLKALQEHYS